MAAPLIDPWDDASWVEQLIAFDEALRLGRTPALRAPVDPGLLQTQKFLLHLQSVWPRAPKKIGPYTLVRSLGQGAIGPSYLVEEPGAAQRLVLKILWPELSDDAATRQQFVQDAQSAQKLRHAGIAAVRAVRERGPLCIVVSEFCAGISLAQWRRKTPQPIAWESAGGLIAHLADILEAAHRQGVSHGSLKPSNIFLNLPSLSESGTGRMEAEITPSNLHQAAVRVADFALAKAVQETRLPAQAGLAWPMPQFLAPEQLQHRARPSEPASDLYALGVMWYDLLTGRCPIHGTTREEIRAQARHAVPPPRQYRPEVPPEVETLVLQCLQRNLSDRPASAQQLADALRAILPAAAPAARPAFWKKWFSWM